MNHAHDARLVDSPADSLDKLVTGVKQLVSLPSVFVLFENELASPAVSSESLAEILLIDPDITARLLSLANSAFFGFSSRVETVQRAVVLIGTSQIRDLILTTVVIDRFSKMPIGILDMGSFWRHSIGTAALAQAIASELRIRGADKFFVGGLLHDIGRLVLLLKRPEEMVDVLLQAQREERETFDLEQDAFDFNHADVGGALARAWGLPEGVTKMIEVHHRPNDVMRQDVDIVHLADLMAHGFEWGQSGQRLVPALCREAWLRVGLNTRMVTEVHSTGLEIYEEMQSLIFG